MRARPEAFASAYPSPSSTARASLVDRYERGDHGGLIVDVVCTNFDRFEKAERTDALLRLLDRAAPEQIAGNVRQTSADDPIVDVPVAGNVDRPEDAERAGFRAQHDPGARRIDRLARDPHLRIRTPVVLQNLDGTLTAVFSTSSVSATPARSGKSSARSSRTQRAARRSLRAVLFNDDRLSGCDFRRDPGARHKKGGSQVSGPAYGQHAFLYSYRYHLPARSARHLLFRRREVLAERVFRISSRSSGTRRRCRCASSCAGCP